MPTSAPAKATLTSPTPLPAGGPSEAGAGRDPTATSAGMDSHRTFVGRFYRWCEDCKEASARESDFYEYSGIPTLNGGRPTPALPPHYTAKGLCRQMCLPCDKGGNGGPGDHIPRRGQVVRR
ncbi:hypothetical protein Esi_0255_0012 [Ectocarpus siliculosus]|uniref:Uncharacterized protein n=1 Tax=Ectocarpus siliculosus TaxID=2880 RepID=D7FTP5_ECTSI|nr:hypothetical protein Esi_0255_0012 [Ectocarpus siliculosus]|eukprot:CBJ31422.1 hypothetical protein Esi_0255_0012 [Ectocarpus siliculosus]